MLGDNSITRRLTLGDKGIGSPLDAGGRHNTLTLEYTLTCSFLSFNFCLWLYWFTVLHSLTHTKTLAHAKHSSNSTQKFIRSKKQHSQKALLARAFRCSECIHSLPPRCFPSHTQMTLPHPSNWRGNVLFRTNLENKGLISADRNNKATLLLTIPRSVFKSSTKDLSSPISEIAIRWLPQQRFRLVGSHPCMIPDTNKCVYL